MSMNELHTALTQFRDTLESFHRDLATSTAIVAEAQERLLNLGDDDFLAQFGARLHHLKDPVDQYQQGVPRVEAAVNDKLLRVERYFHG